MVTVDPIPRPLRDVHIDYEIDNEKCINCVDKPCLNVCPIDAVYQDENTKFIKLDEHCFGCVLCTNACPYDAIHIKKTLADPIRENVPNINKKLWAWSPQGEWFLQEVWSPQWGGLSPQWEERFPRWGE